LNVTSVIDVAAVTDADDACHEEESPFEDSPFREVSDEGEVVLEEPESPMSPEPTSPMSPGRFEAFSSKGDDDSHPALRKVVCGGQGRRNTISAMGRPVVTACSMPSRSPLFDEPEEEQAKLAPIDISESESLFCSMPSARLMFNDLEEQATPSGCYMRSASSASLGDETGVCMIPSSRRATSMLAEVLETDQYAQEEAETQTEIPTTQRASMLTPEHMHGIRTTMMMPSMSDEALLPLPLTRKPSVMEIPTTRRAKMLDTVQI